MDEVSVRSEVPESCVESVLAELYESIPNPMLSEGTFDNWSVDACSTLGFTVPVGEFKLVVDWEYTLGPRGKRGVFAVNDEDLYSCAVEDGRCSSSCSVLLSVS